MNSVICYYPWNLFAEDCNLVLATSVLPTQSTFLFYLGVFLLTCVLESGFYYFFGKMQKLSKNQIIEQIFLLNLATHPIVYFVFPYFLDRANGDTFTYIWTAELFAFAIEALLLKLRYRYSWKMAVMASGLANLFSWSFGIWLQTQGLL